jgi:hypothetical protein
LGPSPNSNEASLTRERLEGEGGIGGIVDRTACRVERLRAGAITTNNTDHPGHDGP